MVVSDNLMIDVGGTPIPRRMKNIYTKMWHICSTVGPTHDTNNVDVRRHWVWHKFPTGELKIIYVHIFL